MIKERQRYKLGIIKSNNFGTDMKIIDVVSSNKIIIQFQDDYKYETEIFYHNFNRGVIRNPYDKTAYGVGFIGVGEYSTGDKLNNNYPSTEYTSWKNLMRRCYSEKDKEKYPAYYGICTVCEEWLNFQVYAKWYYENYYTIGKGRMHLDKDVLVKDNKIYSPETCCFIPQRINMIFMEKTKTTDADLPNTIWRCVNGFRAAYNGKSLGVFKTLEDAVNAHDTKKRIHIKKVANEYKEKLKPYIYEALMNW